MRISLNQIKKYIQIPNEVSDQELIELIGSRLVEIEEVIDLTPKYQGIYIVKVVSCEPIPDTHLNLCQIDAGEHTKEFSENDTVQVVCGAPNVHAGMLAVWITPGSIVPETYGNENFRLSIRKLRGYESNGMLAGADELDFDDEHKAIAEIDPKIAQPGDSLSEIFELDDIILDVENKSLTHRPDCFGLIGFAREVAGILGQKFIEPEPFINLSPKITTDSSVPIKVKIEDNDICPRYSCAVFDLPKNEPSKYLTKEAIFLAKAGMRAIDPIVDLTNILMLETGQPLHAFDYDKLVAVGGKDRAEIVVRSARDGEELQLLDGKTIQCISDDILITSSDVPVALAGAMGGKNTEVDVSTKHIVLESATFSLYHLRKTQMAHGIFSEAITRFTKGQPAPMTYPVLAEAMHRLGIEPLAVVDEYPNGNREVVIDVTTVQINGLLGTDYNADVIIETLENVGFKVEVAVSASSEGIRSYGEEERRDPVTTGVANAPRRGSYADTAILKVASPAWRTDIHIAEDIIEEVGRLLGYDNIALSLPTKKFIEPEVDPMIRLKSELRGILSDQLRMNEVLTYSFVSRSLLEKTGEEVSESYEIVNSISPELQCFRQQIVPSLLDKTMENVKAGHHEFSLYEMNQVSMRGDGLTEEGTPVLKTHLGIVSLNNFYGLKAMVLAMFKALKMPIEYRVLTTETAQHDTYLEPKRAVELIVNGQKIGAFGELKLSVAKKFKLDRVVSALEINLDKIVSVSRDLKTELKLSRFPSVERDLTLKVSSDMVFGRVHNALDACLDKYNLYYTIEPISIYQAEAAATTKNLSFHIKFANPTKTLDSTEISDIMEGIKVELAQIGAEIV